MDEIKFWRMVARETNIDPATLRSIREETPTIKLRTLDTLSQYVARKLKATRTDPIHP